jgi:hypothetical protein
MFEAFTREREYRLHPHWAKAYGVVTGSDGQRGLALETQHGLVYLSRGQLDFLIRELPALREMVYSGAGDLPSAAHGKDAP